MKSQDSVKIRKGQIWQKKANDRKIFVRGIKGDKVRFRYETSHGIHTSSIKYFRRLFCFTGDCLISKQIPKISSGNKAEFHNNTQEEDWNT